MRSLIKFELQKILARHLTLAAVGAVLLLSAILSFSSLQSMYAFDGKSQEGSGRRAVEIDKAIAERYKGVLTDQKVRQMMADFKITGDLHGMNAAYLYQNAIQSAAFLKFSNQDGDWNGRSVSDVFGEEEIKIGYVKGWLHTSRNLSKIQVVLSLVIILMIAPAFSGEYSGMDQIILTSRYGKRKCAAAKVAACLIAALSIAFLILAFQLILAFVFYGREGLDCSILFADAEFEEYLPVSLTCGILLGCQILLAFTGTVSVTGITLLLSAAGRNQTTSLAAAAAIHILPALLPVSEKSPLFRILGLLPVYQFQGIQLMSAGQMKNGMLCAVWAVPASVLFFAIGAAASCRIFAGHQVN